MVMIRMRRAGSKNRAFFRIVVTESAAAREGRFIEILGHYNPRTTPETLVIDRERYNHWLSTGATASDTLRTIPVPDALRTGLNELVYVPAR